MGEVPDKPWLRSYPEGVAWDQTFEGTSLQSILDDSAAAYPDHIHIDFLGRTYRYHETLDLANRIAKGLQELGVGSGDRVGIFMPNCPQYVWMFFGILKAGGVVVNLSPLYSSAELAQQIADSGADKLITLNLRSLVPKVERLVGEGAISKVVMCRLEDALPRLKGYFFRFFDRRRQAPGTEGPVFVSERQLSANDGAFSCQAIDPHENLAVLQYTGGTTGLPKGAMLTHANLSINLQQALAWERHLEKGSSTFLTVLPMFHAFAMTVIMCGGTALAAKLVILARFEAAQTLAAIRRTRPDFLPVVPTMLSAMLAVPDFSADDFNSVRSCLSGGAPLADDLRIQVDEALDGAAVREGYGLTECSPIAIGNPKGVPGRPGSVGLPVPATEVIISEPEDPSKLLGQGEVGEICLAGPQIMKGYWQRPEATAEALYKGRLRTGDLGYLDADGYLYIVDRIKDMILVGGFNVYPRIIEEAIFEHPKVREAAVIGLSDPHLGEAPVAFVVPHEDGALEEADLLAFLKERIGKHEMPRRFYFRPELPQTMVGKVDKKALKAEFSGASGVDAK
jgi:long-chain acyl-CoA synthetase